MRTEKYDNFTDYYGNSYDFYLDDAVGEKDKSGEIKYYKEYFVNIENFIKVAREYGLRLVENYNFLEYYE